MVELCDPIEEDVTGANGRDALGVTAEGDRVLDDMGDDVRDDGVVALGVGAEGDDGVVALGVGVEGDDGVDTVGLTVDVGAAVVGAPVTGFTEGGRVRTVLGDSSVNVTFLITLWPLSLIKRLPDESTATPSG